MYQLILRYRTINERTLQGGSNVVEEFREACGPADPEVAKELRPHSLRAILGEQQVDYKNNCSVSGITRTNIKIWKSFCPW